VSKKKKHKHAASGDIQRAEVERLAREAAIRAALRACHLRRAIRARGPAALASAARRAPRLFEDIRWAEALRRLAEQPFVRRVQDWEPRGKGRDALFRSLAAHLLATVPVPAIVWSAFHDEHAGALVPLAVNVARGGSLFDWAKTFAIPLTRRMCHELLAMPADVALFDSIRRVQARVAGATPRFFDAWRATRYAQRIGTPEEERFWYSVVEWFAKAPLLDAEHVGPLCDYVDHRRRESDAFSMSGRAPLAMIRAMHAWHGELAVDRSANACIFPKSGFTDFLHRAANETWSIREILTSRALAHEGRRMRHCVYSYAASIKRGGTSIWSVQMDDGLGVNDNLHVATLEVDNARRRLVQARGPCNRAITSRDLTIVRLWAGANNLSLGRL
jgi:hypothetical protein